MLAILDGKIPAPCESTREWAVWFSKADRTVRRTQVGPHCVSTVFLGIDHSFGVGIPLWFETMVFGEPEIKIQERYHTWEEAEAGHEEVVKLVREGSNGAPG